jgi:hypothetical protein
MLVDYTTVRDRPSVSVEGPTQHGIESVVEVTPASGVTSDGLAIHPSGSCSSERFVPWLELPPVSSSSPSPSGSPPAVGMPCGGARGISAWGAGEESCCSWSWRRRSCSSCRWWCSLSRWLDWPNTVRRSGRSARREGKKGITDLCAVHLIRAIYKRHRKHKSKSRTMRPESKQKEMWDKTFWDK